MSKKKKRMKNKQSFFQQNGKVVILLTIFIASVVTGGFLLSALSIFLFPEEQQSIGIPEYLCNVGDHIILNITESTLPITEDMSFNQSIEITITDLNYSSRPNEDSSQIFHGAFVFGNVIERNGTGEILDNSTDWIGCYNLSNINLGFANVSYIINASFFIAPTNFTAYIEVMEIFFEFGFGMNVTENSSSPTRHNITAWNGTLSGSGAGVHAQKWNIMFDTTKNIVDEMHVWNWTGSAWSSVVNGSWIEKSWI